MGGGTWQLRIHTRRRVEFRDFGRHIPVHDWLPGPSSIHDLPDRHREFLHWRRILCGIDTRCVRRDTNDHEWKDLALATSHIE